MNSTLTLRHLCGLALCLALCFAAAARTQGPPPAPAAPGLVVEKHGWSKARAGGFPASFGGPLESTSEVRASIREGRVPVNANTKPPAARRDRATRTLSGPPRPRPAVYAYKLTVRNDGGKTIREIDWDYVFLSAATGKELSRRQFTSTERVRPGKRKELTILTTEEPTLRVGVSELGKGEAGGLAERVVVLRVLYEDGSVWRPN